MELRLEQVAMEFGSVVALKDVSFYAQSGQVTCLLGDNGAGKSTLIRILSGVYLPTRGEYLIDGAAVRLASPRAALQRGIATVHQDLGLVPLMSVWRNFFLGAEPTTGWGPARRIKVRECRQTTAQALAEMAISIRDPDQAVGMLSGGERQSIAIARALHRGAHTLILDEPTAALGVKQAGLVLQNIARARDRGVCVVLVTHNPAHAVEVGDRFVVLRQGSVIALRERGNVASAELAQLMADTSPSPSLP